MPGHGLEQGWGWVLAVPKTLPVPVPGDILLPGRIPHGVQVHACRRVEVRPHRGRGPSCRRRTGQGSALCPRLLQSHRCSRPQTSLQTVRGQIPRGHPKHQTQESEGEDAALPVLHRPHPRNPQQDHRRILPPPHWHHKPSENATPGPPTVDCPRSSPKIPSSLLAGISIAPQSEEDVQGLSTAMCAAVSNTPLGWENVQIATAADSALQDLAHLIEEGPPDRRPQMPPAIRAFFPYCESLSNVDGVLTYKDRIIIPTSLRRTCLDALRVAHQGTSRMTARAESSIFWPGMIKDIATTRDRCTICNGIALSQPAMPSTTPETPIYLFQHACGDFFHHMGISYLVQGTHPYLTSPSLPMGSQTQSHLTADQSSRHRSLEPSSKTGRAPQNLISLPSPRQLQGGGRREVLIAGNTAQTCSAKPC